MIYTGIGSRYTPERVQKLMWKFGYFFGQKGWTLRSGHAEGADQAFEDGAKKANGKMEIFLPWEGFENAPQNDSRYIDIQKLDSDLLEQAEAVAATFHPAWERCSPGARKLHMRNAFQVAGPELAVKSELVICWTPEGRRGGGTGVTTRIADHLKIPVFDLAVTHPDDIFKFLDQLG